jgi:phage tail sheath protein FI
MAVQVSYPGVYIEEFAPGAPIQGVGTNTAAFIGTAMSGPIGRPTLIQSWDAFVSRFGGFIAEPPLSYLPPAANGFFRNGGTACYIVRVGTGAMAKANLDSRQGGPNPEPVLVAAAIQEGLAGNSISLQVVESSRLASLVTRNVPQRDITAVSGDRVTLTVNTNQGYAGGEVVTLKKNGDAETMIVASTQGNDQLVLAGAIPGAVDFTGGTVEPAGTLAVWRVETDITAVSGDRTTLTVNDNSGFVQGDRVGLANNGDSAVAMVKSTSGNDTIVLTAPISGAADFSAGKVRSADLTPGQRTLRLAAPAAVRLNQALPAGTALRITLGGASEVRSVESAGGDTVTLTDGLTNAYSLGDPSDLPTVASLEFDLVVTDAGSGESESFEQLAISPSHPSYWDNLVVSEFITLAEPDMPPAPMPADPRPVATTYNLAGGTADDRAAAWNDLTANPSKYLDLLKPYDEIALVAIPGATDQAVQQAIIDHCEEMYDRFAILDSIRGAELSNGIRDQFGSVYSKLGFAALYYPWVQTRNPLTGKDELLPPSGHIAGVYARTDQERGVHKAPANTNIRGALGVERRLTDEEQGPLNLMGIDVIRVFPGQSVPIVWGARTIAEDRNWQYINVRRLLLFIEESIQEGIRWAVFEPNNRQLWQKLKRTITEFLTRVWRDGALFGDTPDEAFYVRIDDALNPVSEQRLGRLNIEIGVRPTYPAEFIVVRIGLWEGGSDVSES